MSLRARRAGLPTRRPWRRRAYHDILSSAGCRGGRTCRASAGHGNDAKSRPERRRARGQHGPCLSVSLAIHLVLRLIYVLFRSTSAYRSKSPLWEPPITLRKSRLSRHTGDSSKLTTRPLCRYSCNLNAECVRRYRTRSADVSFFALRKPRRQALDPPLCASIQRHGTVPLVGTSSETGLREH